MVNKIERIGETFITKEKYKITIVEYFGRNNCSIIFEDEGILYNKTYKNIKDGSIKNRNHLTLFNVGFIGYGIYNSKDFSRIYNTWKNMLERCYSKDRQLKQPTYKGCIVAPEWHNFQVFAEWYEENYVEGFHLDKDILIKGNKKYSPETCCFVPREVNMLMTKFFNSKEKLIYETSLRYYKENKINLKIFKALNNYELDTKINPENRETFKRI